MNLDAGSEGALLSTLLDQSHECIKLLDSQGRILFVNREGSKMMELGTPDDLVGQLWTARWPAEVRPLVEDALAAARHGSVSRFTAPRPGPDNEVQWLDVTLTPVAAGAAASFISIARDITAEVAERARAATVSAEMRHRLRNGMTIAAGIVMLEARSAKEHQKFAQSVSERFSQLAHVQELVLDPESNKSLTQILHLLSQVYGGGSLLKIGDLPDVQLSDSATQALALTVGELATNSLKYGALRAGNPVSIDGDATEGDLSLTWREPTCFGEPRAGGEGRGLIDRLMVAAKGQLSREISDGLLVVRVTLPIKRGQAG